MKVKRVEEEEVEITLQPELFLKERRGKEKEERGNPVEEVTAKEERKEERKVERKEETEMDRKGRVEEAMITLAEVSRKMKRAMAIQEWGVMESLKNRFNPAWNVLRQAEPECGWEEKWYVMHVDASIYLAQAMLALRRFGVVEQVVGRPGEGRVKVPNPGDPGWSAQRVAQWYVLRAFTRMELRHLKEAEEDLEEAEKLAKRAVDRWGRRMVEEVEKMRKEVRGRRGRR